MTKMAEPTCENTYGNRKCNKIAKNKPNKCKKTHNLKRCAKACGACGKEKKCTAKACSGAATCYGNDKRSVKKIVNQKLNSEN